eukprot:5054915-Prymnesium_polylepis.1
MAEDHHDKTQRRRRRAAAVACTQSRPAEGDMRALVEELFAHADDMHRGDRWTVGEAGTGVTETESKQDEE